MQDYLGIAFRILVIYAYAQLILRLSGKRSLDTLTPLDFVVGLIIGDLFDNIIWADVPLAQGLVAITTIVLLHSLLSLAAWKSQRLHDLVCSTAQPVIRDGKFLDRALARARTTAGEIEMLQRLVGEDKQAAIKQACLETSGELSIEKQPSAKPVQKRDLAALRKVA